MAIMAMLNRLKKAPKNDKQAPLDAYWPLYQVYKQHQFIYVLLKGEDTPLQSMILSMDPAAGTMEIDEFFPRNHSCMPGQRISVIVRGEEGRSIQFNTYVLAREVGDGALSFTIRLPEQVKNHQRREAFRLPVEAGVTGTRTVLHVGDDEGDSARRFLARIKDLSATGMGLQIEGDTSEVIPVGSRVSSRIDLAGLNIECLLDIRRASTCEEPESLTEIGAEFIDLAVSEQRALTRYIMESQRRVRRM